MTSSSEAKSATFLPPPCRTRQMFNKKKDFIRDEKTDSIGSLPQLVDKFYIDDSTKSNTTNKLIRELATQEETTEQDFKKIAIPFYDIDRMSPQELQDIVCEIEETPREPFSFLMKISKAFTDAHQISAKSRKPSEIDTQLTAVAKRIESSKALLEEAKSRIEEIRFRVRDVTRQSSDI